MTVIMVVDDEPDILFLIDHSLKKWQYTTESYTNPEKALDSFKANPLKYSLLLSDIRMPGMSGIELVTIMSELNPQLKVLLMTAFEIDRSTADTMPIVVSEVLRKPFKLSQVCESVKKHLQVASYHSIRRSDTL